MAERAADDDPMVPSRGAVTAVAMTANINCGSCCYWSPQASPPVAAAPHRFGGMGAMVGGAEPLWRGPPLGQCRRFPPFMAPTPKGMRAQWPITTGAQWCGEHGVVDAARALREEP